MSQATRKSSSFVSALTHPESKYSAALTHQELAVVDKTPCPPNAKRGSTEGLGDKEIAARCALLAQLLPSLPDARLIIAAPHYYKNELQASSIVSFPQTAEDRVAFGVLQTSRDADFNLSLPLKVGSKSIQISCKIIYDPTSDNGVFFNNTGPKLCLVSLDVPKADPIFMTCGSKRAFTAGKWRITAVDHNYECYLAEFWLRPRTFGSSTTKTTVSRLTKRSASDDGAEIETAKRQKISNDSATTVSPLLLEPETKEPNPLFNDVDFGSLFSTVQIIPSDAPKTIVSESASKDAGRGSEVSSASATPGDDPYTNAALHLVDGETAVVWGIDTSQINFPESISGARGIDSYNLQHIKEISNTAAVSVFICRHSSIPEDVVAKVLRSNKHNCFHAWKLWMTEQSILDNIKHNNIVSLKAYDSRLMTLYLERLPQSLFRGTWAKLKQPDAFTVLRDISDALVYLSTEGITHGDIKPSNITYSPQRGAVLIDFGLAGYGGQDPGGGTPWYFPPLNETHGKLEKRGFSGDVWALGVTMLYLLRKIEWPERSAITWRKGNEAFRLKESGEFFEKCESSMPTHGTIAVGVDEKHVQVCFLRVTWFGQDC
ncbi:kinase-like domain-containing protein [Trichoderma sp. SZMC 28014]